MEPDRRNSRSVTRTELYKQIETVCSDILAKNVVKHREYSRTKIASTVHSEHRALCREDGARLRYLETLRGAAPDDIPWNIHQRTDASACVDQALESLHEIVADAKKNNSRGVPIVEMPSVENVPKYDAWVPVRTNFWVGKDMELEPYMPYFGDDNEGRCKAFDLYKDMARDANQENNLSDGEVNDRGEILEPSNEEAWVLYESLPQVRWRAACREAIVQVLDAYDEEDDNVYEAIMAALGIESKKRLKAVAKIALERREAKIKNDLAREKRDQLYKETINARSAGLDDVREEPTGKLMKEAMRYFCFTCQLFYCRQHDNRDVVPSVPIRDLEVERRELILSKPNAEACSTKCFLADANQVAPEEPHETEPWTPTELGCLREMIPVFHHDPCKLALVVGTRNCRDVFAKLEEPQERISMRRAIYESKQKRKIDSKLKNQRLIDSGIGGHDSDVEELPIYGGTHGSLGGNDGDGRGKKKAVKQLDNKGGIGDDNPENEDFIPCYHVGECTIDVCSCLQRNLPCELTCCCRNIRFAVGKEGKGMARFVDRVKESRRNGDMGICKNIPAGCHCKTGHCNTDECECWASSKACNPDLCDSCDCCILPTQLPSSARRCRNVSVSIARHKRTIVGKSKVHGYGLFAADYFAQGDLIGIYGGQLLDTRLADMVGRLYDAKDHTFFFDITESIVIDGGVLGMKSKFCNHIHADKPGENCHSKLVRVRGDANIALFAKRNIQPGEELMFDYKFQTVVPPWAEAEKKNTSNSKGRKEEPQLIDDDGNGNGNGNGNRERRRGSKRKAKSRR